METADTFTVHSVDELFAITEGIVRITCEDGSMLMIDRESYLQGKVNAVQALGVSPSDVDFVGMTLTLDDEGVPALAE